MSYSVEPDPDHAGFFSVFVDNGHGCSAEVCGKIGDAALAEEIAAHLNATQPL